MEIDNRVVPFTATHYSFKSKEFIRIGKGTYAEVLLEDKLWVECSVLKNSHLPIRNGFNDDYMRIFKTGVSRSLCNLRLLFIGSSYRIQ